MKPKSPKDPQITASPCPQTTTPAEKAPAEKRLIRQVIEASSGLSLGLSVVAAVLIGLGLGWALRRFTPWPWLFWLGVFWGLAAAGLNIYKAYKAQVKSYEEYAQRDAELADKIAQAKDEWPK